MSRDALQAFGLPDNLDVRFAVAGPAHHAGHADPALAALDRRLVHAHFHALQRAVAGRMAVHAAWML